MFTFSESTVAKTVGIRRELIKEARARLEEETDWKLVDRTVKYSATGLERLQEALGLPDPIHVEGQPDDVATAPSEQKKRAAGVVTRLTRNSRILLAMIDGDLCRVRVKRSDGFKTRMTIDVEHVDADLWKFVGRYPRRRIQPISAA